MKQRKMAIWFGLIVCSPGLGLRRSVVVWRGRMRQSPNVKSASIHIRTISPRIAPPMLFRLKRARGKLIARREWFYPQNMIYYRAFRSKRPVLSVGWDGSMTYQNWEVSKVLVGTWQSIFLKRLSLVSVGRKVGGA